MHKTNAFIAILISIVWIISNIHSLLLIARSAWSESNVARLCRMDFSLKCVIMSGCVHQWVWFIACNTWSYGITIYIQQSIELLAVLIFLNKCLSKNVIFLILKTMKIEGKNYVLRYNKMTILPGQNKHSATIFTLRCTYIIHGANVHKLIDIWYTHIHL